VTDTDRKFNRFSRSILP